MAKSHRQTQKDYVNRLRQDPEKLTDYKQKRSSQSKECRERKKLLMSEEEIELKRQYERERKQKQRAKKSKPLTVKLSHGKYMYL